MVVLNVAKKFNSVFYRLQCRRSRGRATLQKIPVLLVGFNRPVQTRKVLDQLSTAPISELFIWLDGPRKGNDTDVELCREVKNLVDEAQFAFPVTIKSHEHNLGCRDSVSRGISWFFTKVEKGAILEDDCLPSPDFFSFMASLLEHYEDSHDIFTIAGHMLNPNWKKKENSYHFSRYPHIWGWGTWRRVWDKYDPHIHAWEKLRKTRWLEDELGLSKDAARYWRYQFDGVRAGRIDTWDHQLAFLSLLHKALNVVPHVNLVSNIGFGPNATHTRAPNSRFRDFEIEAVGEINFVGPPSWDAEEDRATELEIFRTRRPLSELALLALRQLVRILRRKTNS